MPLTVSNPAVVHLRPSLWARDVLGLELDEWQARAIDSPSRRLLLCCARQTGKTLVAAVLSAYTAVCLPGSVTIIASPSLRQSQEVFRRARYYVQQVSPHYEIALLEDNRLSLTTSEGSRIISLPSTHSRIRGLAAIDLVVEDEAAWVDDEVYYAVLPMLAVSRGRLLLMSTPYGQRGHFYREWSAGEGWERVRITAYECPRISAEFLAEQRQRLPWPRFAAEYLCEFLPSESEAFTAEEIRRAISDEVETWEL